MSRLPIVAVVILNYNGRKYLEQFLPSVKSSTYGNLEIIIADNGSTDDSTDFLSKNYPEIKCIDLKHNYGFAEGYNKALQQINADYYVLLNSDVEVTPEWIEPVITLMEKDLQIAICQPLLLSYHKKEYFEYAGAGGGWIDFLGYPFARGRVFEVLEKNQHQFSTSSDIFWASGAAMFVKSSIYHKLGGLYGYFFAHQEEIDFCWRAQNNGYKVGCVTESVVFHVGGGTLPKGSARKTFLNFRNNLIMLSRNLPKFEKYWKIPFRLILDGVFALKCALSGDFVTVKAILKAHFAFYQWSFSPENKHLSQNVKMTNLSGVYPSSLVWRHYIQGKKYFKDLF